jgi:exopolysaccharide biosynthesis polyprenyl glycosylphosphotransferase
MNFAATSAHAGAREQAKRRLLRHGAGRPGPRRQPEAAPARPARRSLFLVAAEIDVQPRTRLSRGAKRTMDVIGSALGLLVLAPVFLLVALAVRLSSRGPAFFVQDRCGLGGKPFRFYKFRTMCADAETRKAQLAHLNEVDGPAFKLARDPRVTRLGSLLRRTSLDELPQLWNVLKGDMSLVGPRPPTREEVERYNVRHAQRLSVVPGITGLWQVSGRSQISDFERWIDLDLHYIRSWSLWLDLRILARTVLVVLLTRGAQ